MLALHTALYALVGTCFLFSVVELGLCAYIASVWSGTRSVGYDDLFAGYVPKNVDVSTPGILTFLIFSACWSILVAVAALVLPWFYTSKGFVTAKLNAILGIVFAVVYFVTWVFWLACFADIASMLGGFTSYNNFLNAVIALAVLLWFLFLDLFILSILALCGVLVSDRAGYQSMRKTQVVDAPETREAGPAAQDMPASTVPAPAPSELSTREVEAMHNQPVSRAHSTSSPSAIASVELSGDSAIHSHHASHA
ncbi:uncharacterized protein N7498_006031 [Penicillium cinerascens]|uniref:MARVEL domain-containing protein n=1 Tax=Penicillium cinerascens TaxID=70096 RepID=A0A9W9MHF0_9EURO|nr:uncharacterized protein N7498_006031 [Penicillium cinerascens]KAJ5201368.1 hypothetical protein N7498_006031 [Penicillium cinerascens]